jgi:hypothetical protein
MTKPRTTKTVVVHLSETESGWMNLGPIPIKSGDSGILAVTPNGGKFYIPLVHAPNTTGLFEPGAIAITISNY